jgi:hypothetical protein
VGVRDRSAVCCMPSAAASSSASRRPPAGDVVGHELAHLGSRRPPTRSGARRGRARCRRPAPSRCCRRPARHRAAQQVGAAPAGQQLDGLVRAAVPGGVHDPLVEVHLGTLEPGGPHQGGGQRLGRLGPVGDAGLERVDGRGPPAAGLGALVGVDEVGGARSVSASTPAGITSSRPSTTSRSAPPPARSSSSDGPDPAEGAGRLPGHADAQPPRSLVSSSVSAVPSSCLAIARVQPGRRAAAEGLPVLPGRAGAAGQQRHRPGDADRAVEAVVGLVGEERAVRVDAARGEGPGAGDEHPQVAVGHDRGQERLHVLEPSIRYHLARRPRAGVRMGGRFGCAWETSSGSRTTLEADAAWVAASMRPGRWSER